MKTKETPFQITNAIIDYVADIAELIGSLSLSNHFSAYFTMRRANCVRAIHGSLAIEQNALRLEQVAAIINGKQILAPLKDIAEVKNVYELYGRLDELDPYSLDDLLIAQGIITCGLIDESSAFRSQSQYICSLVKDLLDWTKNCDLHMLIRSCVFHYELEVIHPFECGNGQIGCLWNMLLLSKWNPIFMWLPLEFIIHTHQQEYYTAINTSYNAGQSTAFIEFMLSTIKVSLVEAIDLSNKISSETVDKASSRWSKIEGYLKIHPFIMNADVRELCRVSAATANRILSGFVEERSLFKYREGGHWAYKLS